MQGEFNGNWSATFSESYFLQSQQASSSTFSGNINCILEKEGNLSTEACYVQQQHTSDFKNTKCYFNYLKD